MRAPPNLISDERLSMGARLLGVVLWGTVSQRERGKDIRVKVTKAQARACINRSVGATNSYFRELVTAGWTEFDSTPMDEAWVMRRSKEEA